MTLPNPLTFGGRRQWRWLVLARGWLFWLGLARAYRITLGRATRVTLVTGSYGKTTATRAIRAALGLPADSWTELNTNCLGEIGWTLLRSHPFRRHNVVEAGAGSPGRFRRYVAATRPQTAVVTWIGSEHLARFGSIEALMDEKSEALRALPADGIAFLNCDDPRVRAMATRTRAQVRWFGTGPQAGIRGTNIRTDWPRGLRFELHVGGRSREVAVRLHGERMVFPILAAIGVGLEAGVPLDVLLERLSELPPTSGRLEVHAVSRGLTFIRDDYKATPETFVPALDLLKEAPARRRWVVVGHLNNLPDADEAGAYAAIGRMIGDTADEILVLGGVGAAYEAGVDAGRRRPRVRQVEGVHAAIQVLREELQSGDVVLIKGYEDQGLARILFAFLGRAVRCPVEWCTLRHQRCDDCRYLGRADSPGGWVPSWSIGPRSLKEFLLR